MVGGAVAVRRDEGAEVREARETMARFGALENSGGPIYSGTSHPPFSFWFFGQWRRIKHELQSDANQYREAISAMRQTHKEGEFLKVIEIAIYSCEFVYGMMQFERRFEERGERKSVESIDYLVEVPPPLVFECASSDIRRELWRSQRADRQEHDVEPRRNPQRSVRMYVGPAALFGCLL